MAYNPSYDRSRPLLRMPDLSWFKRINWIWFLQRLPMVALAIPAAWGAGSFAAERLPWQIAVFAGFGFESCYIGAIALADQQHDKDDIVSMILWWILNAMAVVSSIVTNTLFFSGGKYASITPEAITHAAPFALLAFTYGLVLHRSAMKQSSRIYCDICKTFYKNKDSYNGHKRSCKAS
jgi:tellurite resistance protein TehA-like permease